MCGSEEEWAGSAMATGLTAGVVSLEPNPSAPSPTAAPEGKACPRGGRGLSPALFLIPHPLSVVQDEAGWACQGVGSLPLGLQSAVRQPHGNSLPLHGPQGRPKKAAK